MILGEEVIRELCREEAMIIPFKEPYRDAHGLSGGVGPAGYDVTIEFDSLGSQRTYVLAPGEFILASTIERFMMPHDVLGIVHDKSTWARRGIAVQNTVIEPGWRGYLTLELTNHHRTRQQTLYRGMPIAQIVFHRVEGAGSYEGRYQDQPRGPVRAKKPSNE